MKGKEEEEEGSWVAGGGGAVQNCPLQETVQGVPLWCRLRAERSCGQNGPRGGDRFELQPRDGDGHGAARESLTCPVATSYQHCIMRTADNTAKQGSFSESASAVAAAPPSLPSERPCQLVSAFALVGVVPR